jgi:hypothetical protein
MRIDFLLFQPLDQFDIFILNFCYFSSKIGLFFSIDSFSGLFILDILNYLILNLDFSNLLIYLLILLFKITFNINIIEISRIRLITLSL